MIRLRDGFVLAGTKLRTRKTRTIVTAVLASLLFAGLVLAFTITRGGIDSYARYSKNGLSQRYITNTLFYDMNNGVNMTSPELIAKAKERNKQVIADKKADAKRLGLDYDALTEPAVTLSDDMNGLGESLNTQNFAVQQIVKEESAKLKTKEDRTKEIAARYNPRSFYKTTLFGDTNNLAIMKLGKESFDTNTRQMENAYTQDTLPTLAYMPRTVVDSFFLDGADLSTANDTNSVIPVIVPFAEAEKATGQTSLPKNASSKERLKRIDEVKKRAVNASITVCYRNSVSKQLIEQTKQQIAEIEKRKNDSTYQRPSQIYALPDSSTCGPVVVTKDTRSADEKQIAAKQKEFNLKYNIETEPVEKKLMFRIVGLSADAPNYESMSTLESLTMMIGGTSLAGQWVIPTELVNESVRSSYIPQQPGDGAGVTNTSLGNLVEFSSAAEAKKFVSEQSCNGADCMTKPVISYFGSNSVLLDEMTRSAANMFWVAGLVVAGIAAVLMMGMVGRVITDSRRETAVFRAIGAKRNDIRLIYALYVTAFSLIIAVSAVALGMGGAWLCSNSATDSFTTSARLMFIESHETAQFSLVGLWPEVLLLTLGVIILTGLASMLLPLARNLARSPLKDMRDE